MLSTAEVRFNRSRANVVPCFTKLKIAQIPTTGLKPLPPSTPAHRPLPPSTPAQRPLPPSTPAQRPLPPSTPTQRPLPPPPEEKRKISTESMNARERERKATPTYMQMPWFHKVERKKAEDMLKNGEDGRFLFRPSRQTQNPLTLTLWYGKRLYNIGVRLRPDQRYALGSEKDNELNFTTMEDLVSHYQKEALVLYSSGERSGKTILTSTPSHPYNTYS